MSLLAALKSETAQQHTALEDGLELFKRAATVEGYLKVVEKFYTLYRPLEERLAGAADWHALGWDFADREKTGWLLADMQALGLSSVEVERLPLCEDIPVLDSLGAAVGCLYVLEGSTLGGQFISKRLQQTLAITPETGGRFFSGYGAETGAKWRRFGEWAEALAAKDPGLQPAAVATAKETFNCFSCWFEC